MDKTDKYTIELDLPEKISELIEVNISKSRNDQGNLGILFKYFEQFYEELFVA
jgi:hypothetical protein